MPASRVIRFYKTPADKKFVNHIFSETGILPEYQQILWSMRNGNITETAEYARQAGLTDKQFNDVWKSMQLKIVPELIRLAEIGNKAEQKTS